MKHPPRQEKERNFRRAIKIVVEGMERTLRRLPRDLICGEPPMVAKKPLKMVI